jgi:branched-chain amino acid transport system substrate-binding protein
MIACGVTPDMSSAEICELLVQYFPTMTFEGTTGTMQWDATGAVTKVPLVVKIVDGAYVTQ